MVDLEVKVTGFTNIISVQFPVTYEETVLQFVSADNFALPGFGPANYNNQAGKVTVSWFVDLGSNPNGITLAAGTTLLRLRFEVIANGSSLVNLEAVPPGIEMVDSNGNPVTVNYQSGGSNVTGGSGGPPPITGFHIITNGDSIGVGEQYCMPVTVNDFVDILSMQYAMHWDPAVLQFDNVSGFQLPFLSGSNFGGNTAGGTLLLSWYDQNAIGITLDDLDTIYQVCFTAVGPVGSESLVNIDGVGFPGNAPAEIADAMGTDIWDTDVPIDGTIYVIDAGPTGDEPTFHAEQDTTFTGGSTCVDIFATNFDSLLSAQFAITYDNALITFTSIDLGANPLSLSLGANFNTNTSGQIRFTWNDGSGLGINLPDSTIIFRICFDAIGPGGSQSPIDLGSITNFPVEVAQEPNGVVPAVMVDGHVYILDTPPPPNIQMGNITDVDCFGANNGAISVSINGGVAPLTYSWAGPNGYTATTEDISNLSPGNYSLTVTDANMVTDTYGPVLVDGPANAVSIPSGTISITPVNCFGGSDGLIDVTVQGGTGPYTYAWNDPGGSTTEDLFPVGVGVYTLTATDANGCTVTSAPLQMTQPNDITINLNSVENVICFGDANGKAFITANGGSAPYSFEWREFGMSTVISTLQNPTNLQKATYVVTVIDDHNCQKAITDPVVVSGPSAALSSNFSPTNVLCPDGNDGFISQSPSGGWGNYDFEWTGPGGPYTSQNITNLSAGVYTPTIMDQGGCSVTLSPITITEPAEITYTNLQVTHLECANDANGSISITPQGGNGGNYVVTWTGGLTGTMISNLDGGNYAPTIRDNQGCTTTMPAITVNKPAPLVSSETITDQMGATDNGEIDLTITGGTMPYSYEWAHGPTTEDVTGLAAGLYTVTITDANDCFIIVENIEIVQSNILLGTFASSTNSCANDGTVTIVIPPAATGPFVVSWNGNTQVSQTDTVLIQNLAPGTYDFTVSDLANNEVILEDIMITSLAPAAVSSQTTPPDNADCIGATNFIVLEPVPNTTAMLYNWSDGPTTSARINIPQGNYSVVVTNITSGCTAVYNYTLNCPAGVATAVVDSASCVNDNDGSIDLSFTGGDGPNYTFEWDGPNGFTANTEDIDNLEAGLYHVTVTDESNVEHVSTHFVGTMSNLLVTNVNELSMYGMFQVSGPNNCDGEASVAFSGQVGNVSIDWSNGFSGMLNETLCGGAYSVTVTDELGCISVWSDSLTVAPGVTSESNTISNYNGYNISCNGECDGIARVFINGGIGPFTVQWPTGQIEELDNIGQFSQANNLCGGDYLVTITDINDNTTTQMVSLSQPDPLEILFAEVAPSSFSRCDGEIIATTPGAVGTVELTWTASITGQTGDELRAIGLCSGERVQFVVRDANGCLAIATDTVPYPEDGCFRVRPVLTPGEQDGKNDFMLITCIESVPNSIEIYNRWGQLVFETVGYDNGTNAWDGTNNGRPLPEGVYYYILNYTDSTLGEQQVKGYVNLLR
jgi:gliding motility-associated-like protein